MIALGTPPTSPAMLPALAHIDAWIFDLDNTLYPASADLFRLIKPSDLGKLSLGRKRKFERESLPLEHKAAER